MSTYLKHDTLGGIKLANAVATSTGAVDAGGLVALDSAGVLDTSLLSEHINPVLLLECAETMSAGTWINIFDNAGTMMCRKASALAYDTNVCGFISSTVTLGSVATIYVRGTNELVTGMTVGQPVYLSVVTGEGTHTPPSSSGNIIQQIGISLSATSVYFNPTDPIELT